MKQAGRSLKHRQPTIEHFAPESHHLAGCGRADHPFVVASIDPAGNAAAAAALRLDRWARVGVPCEEGELEVRPEWNK